MVYEMINLFLYRAHLKPEYTIGNLSIEERFLCNTLEDTVRDLNKDGDLDDPGEFKIYGETAIPYGRYKVIVSMSPKFGRMLPLIMDVKHFVGIRMHRGTSAKNSSGCVLVGMNTDKGRLSDSKYYEEKLTAILLEYQKNGEEIFINIV
jgi:hypothetical protein